MIAVEPITVLIADDIPGTREDIKRLLYFEEDIKVVGEAGDGEEAFNMTGSLNPDVVLMDVNMPRVDGIKASEMITMQNPNAAIVIVSIQGEQEYMRKAMAAGARDYLVKPFTSTDLAETIRRVSQLNKRRAQPSHKGFSTQLHVVPKEKGKIITLFSTKGGSGKTTLACNLAVALTQETRKKVALLDMDLQGGDISLMLNIKTQGGLVELMQEDDYTDISLIETYLSPHLSGVRVLPAPTDPGQAELIDPAMVERLLSALKENYSYIVIDTSTAINEITLTCLESSDKIITVMGQDILGIKHARVNMEILQKLNLSLKSSLVINQMKGDGISTGELEKSIGSDVFAVLPKDDKTVENSLNKGQPFVITQPGAEITAAVKSLAGLTALQTKPEEKVINNNENEIVVKAPRKSLIGKLFSF